MDGLEIIAQARQAMADRDALVADIERIGREMAEARRRHNVALAKAEMAHRQAGNPASMVPDLARGDEEVGFRRFELDCCEARYWANKEAIEAVRDKIAVLREVARREWQQA